MAYLHQNHFKKTIILPQRVYFIRICIEKLVIIIDLVPVAVAVQSPENGNDQVSDDNIRRIRSSFVGMNPTIDGMQDRIPVVLFRDLSHPSTVSMFEPILIGKHVPNEFIRQLTVYRYFFVHAVIAECIQNIYRLYVLYQVYTGEHLNPDASRSSAPDTIDFPVTLPLNTNRTLGCL